MSCCSRTSSSTRDCWSTRWTNAVRVPVPAVQRGEPGTFVYVINANNTVSVRPVKLGPTDGGYTQVISGLQPGEKVVTDGTDRLRDGAKVTVPLRRQPRRQASPAPGRHAGHQARQAAPPAPDAPVSSTGPIGTGSDPRQPARQASADPAGAPPARPAASAGDAMSAAAGLIAEPA